MIRYDHQLRDCKFRKKKSHKKKGEGATYCLNIMSFDIEVSSGWMYDGKIIGYEPGHDAEFWNDLDKYALPYIWQFGIDDDVYYGSEIESFLEVLKDLPDDMQYLIYVHNLSYEMQFLQNILHITDMFARAPHKPFKFRSEEFPYIEFRCSYILSNLSLEKWGNELGVEKLVGDLDYNIIRTPYHYDPETEEITGTPLFDFELDYCEQDVRVVNAGIADLLKIYVDVWDIPLTSTGKVRRKVKESVCKDKVYMNKIKLTLPENAEEYSMLQSVFAGGYTHANRRYLGKTVEGCIHHRDVASFYPTCLCAFKYPMGRWIYIDHVLPDPAEFDECAFIIRLHLKGVKCLSWNTYISGSKCSGSHIIYDNGRILSADELYITVTEMDYLTICDSYEIKFKESLGTWKNVKRYLPKQFIEIVLEFYKGKTELKGKDPDMYALYKTYINALFGMSCTALVQADCIYDQECSSHKDQWTVDDLTSAQVNAKLNDLRRWFDNRYFLSYNTGVYCTAYARRYLWLGIMSIDDDLLYSDTDSFFYIGDHDFSWFDDMIGEELLKMCEYHEIDPELLAPKDSKGIKHRLGVLEVEKDDGAERFRTLGAKKYVIEKDGILYLTVAGINKSAVSCLEGDIERFTPGFIFDKDHPDVHKLEHTYLTDMQPVTWPGGYKSSLKYGINMRPTGYKLSMPNVYDEMQQIFEDGFLSFSEYFLAKHRGYFR